MKMRTFFPALLTASLWVVPAQAAKAHLGRAGEAALDRGHPAAARRQRSPCRMGYRLPPHYHPSYEQVEVREGMILAGMGDTLDAKRTLALTVGDSGTAPAGMQHFSIAKGRTVLAVTFDGPYTITYLHAEDAPQARVFPFLNPVLTQRFPWYQQN